MPSPKHENISDWYVETKLHPPFVRSDIIQRPYLEERLSHSVRSLPLTLLSAPAGYGKTTLLSTLPSLLPNYPIAWVTLDSEDNDPVRFIGLLAKSLQRLHPDCGSSVWPLLSGGSVTGSDMKRAVGILINDMIHFLPDEFILVLDDLHYVTEPLVHIALDYLFEQSPPNLHVAIGTRYDPPIRLTRLAARGRLGEMRRDDLSLNHDESHKLLNVTLGLSLSSSEVAVLQKRTEGWPGVLCLLAGPLGRMDIPGYRTQFMAAITHNEKQALEFLAEEILLYLPEDTRKFLMQTSILQEITPTICRAVTGRDDAADILEGLYSRNLAIASLKTGADGESVYRYHSLFARLLNLQLEREFPEEIAELHQKAAEVQKTPGRAISHYFSAHLWNQAAQLLANSGMELIHKGMSDTVRKWYDRLPTMTRDKYSQLTVLMGRCEIHRGDYDLAGKLLEQARKAFVREGNKEGEGEALTSLITICYHKNDRASAESFVDQALKLPLMPIGQVAARLARAWLHMYESNWEEVYQNIRDALGIPKATGDRRADVIGITYMTAPMAAIPCCLQLTEQYCFEVSSLALPDTAWLLGAQELGAWPLMWRGKMEEALEWAEKAEDLRQRLGGFPFVGNDLPVQLAVMYLAKGELEASEKIVDTLIQRLENTSRSKCMLHLHAAGRALGFLGKHDEAMAMYQRLAALDDNFSLTQYLLAHLKGLLDLLHGNSLEAATNLERAARLEVQIPMAHVGGSARLLQARLLLDKEQIDEAFSMAQPVLDEWQKASTPGFVLLDGPAILPVLKLAAERHHSGAIQMLNLLRGSQHTVEALNTKSMNRQSLEDVLFEPLTPRECDVLNLLIAGCSNIQISEMLHISRETVKTHVAHIFRKLDVRSRTQAVIRARELGF